VAIQRAEGIIAAWETDRETDAVHDFEHGYGLARDPPSRRAGDAEIVKELRLESLSAHQEESLRSEKSAADPVPETSLTQ
jgi:hypothetical protein